MFQSRREILLSLPFLSCCVNASPGSILPSRCYPFDDLPVKTDSKTGAQSRQVFRGTTHDGFPIDLHITTMPPGQMPHPPHHHPHEEIFFVQQGSLAATVNGETTVVGPGSVVYIHSNDEHGIKAVGDVPAQYFVFALGSLTA